MEIFGNIFAGLGLFFIGVKLISGNLKHMTGRRFRRMIEHATGNPLSAMLAGTGAGALTQSTSAVTFVVVSMVAAGLTTVAGALPVVGWANVGTSALVLVATLDIHLVTLFLLGIVGASYYFGLNEDDRFGHGIGAALGLGLLLLGLWLVKNGAAPVKDVGWVADALTFSSRFLLLELLIGVALAVVMQSSATVSVLAVTFYGLGLLEMEQAVLTVIGASVGSGLSILLVSGNLRGTPRQLVYAQAALKFLGAMMVMPFLLVEHYTDVPGVLALLGALADTPANQLAIGYTFLQIVSALVGVVAGPWLCRICERLAPVSPEEGLGRPQFLYPRALDEADTALVLLGQEQGRLLHRIPLMLDSLRPAESSPDYLPVATWQSVNAELSNNCRSFILALLGRGQEREVLEQVVNMRSRNELILHLSDGLTELVDTLQVPLGSAAARRTRVNLVEGLHLLLSTLDDASAGSGEDIALLKALAHDRAALMERVRGDLVCGDIDGESQAALLHATSLFERLVWLVQRLAMLLERDLSNMTEARVAAERECAF